MLRYDEVEAARRTTGRSVLLFLTDRCPVGCKHCCVDSLPGSVTITDFDLFEGIVNTICALPDLRLVGISGGEPFVEKRGLVYAVNALHRADKGIVLYTSGVWGAAAPPAWIVEVIAKTRCVFLSTDKYHRMSIDRRKFVLAAQCIAAIGVWIVVQTLDDAAEAAEAESLLRDALGSSWQ